MTISTPDIIDHLVGIAPGSRLDGLRQAKPITRDNAQKSYLALFATSDIGAMSLSERYAVAAFVTGVHGPSPTARFYADALAMRDPKLAETLAGEIVAAATNGPYGDFPEGPLTSENQAGPSFRVNDATRVFTGERLAAALDHAHLLVFHPRDASSSALQGLIDAGWTTTGIVTLSQLVAFLSFQIRVITGLTALAA